MYNLNYLLFFLLIAIQYVYCNYEWMYYEPYGKTVVLKPIKRNKTMEWFIKECKWTTPDKVDLTAEYVNSNSPRYYIDRTTCDLTIYNIQKDTNGIYHCTVNNMFVSKAMLNYHGPPPKDFLDEYKWNLIAGFSTAGGIMAFFIFICAVAKFRYREEEDKQLPDTLERKTGYEMSHRNSQRASQRGSQRQAHAVQYHVSANDGFDHDVEIHYNERAVDGSVQRF